MALPLPPGFSFPSIDSAMSWIRSKIGEWKALGPRLKQELIRAGQLKTAALQTGDSDRVKLAEQAQQDLRTYLTEYIKWEGRVDPILNYFNLGQNKMGVFPVAVAAIAIPFGLAAAALLYNAYNTFTILDQVERGIVTPKQAADILASKGLFAGALNPLGLGLLALGGFVLWNYVKRS